MSRDRERFMGVVAEQREGTEAWLASREVCDKGHPFAGDNLATRPNGHRKCRRCHADYMRAWNARRRHA